MSQQDIATPFNQEPLPEPDLYAACRDFALAWALPSLQPDQILDGWENLGQLPAGSLECAVVRFISGQQRGTTLQKFRVDESLPNEPGILTIKALFEVQARIEFCSDSDLARLRAQRMRIAAGSESGLEFFRSRGLSCQYAAGIEEVKETEENKQFARRYAATLHLSMWAGSSAEFEYFDTLELARLENADAHHPEKRRP